MTSEFVFLTDIPIFRSLDTPESERLSGLAIRKRFPPDSILQLEGHAAEFFAVQTRGLAKAILIRPDGGEILLHFCVPGDFFGESNICDKTAPGHSIAVIETAEYLFFSAVEIAELIQSNGRFALDLFSYQTRRLADTQERLRVALYERGSGKVMQYFAGLAKQFGVACEDGIHLPVKISHQTVADSCGLARETVTRLLAELKRRKKVVRTDDGWLLRGPQAGRNDPRI